MRPRVRGAFLQLLRWRYVVLCGWLAFLAARRPDVRGADWGWFSYGSDLLFRGEYTCDHSFCSSTQDPGGAGGLHTFGTDPRLHMGPLSLVVAIGANAWGVFLLPLLLGLRRRHAKMALAAMAAVAAAVWLPFLVADWGTLEAARGGAYARIEPSSGARALGFDVGGPAPDWLRPLQALAALGLALLAAVRGRWAAALLVAVAVRLGTDHATSSYYTAALLFGALLWDLFGGGRRLPIWGASVFLAYYLIPQIINDPQIHGLARVAVAVAAIIGVLGTPRSWFYPGGANHSLGRPPTAAMT